MLLLFFLIIQTYSIECTNGTYLNQTTQTCDQCILGCYNCTGSSYSECIKCQEGRYLDPEFQICSYPLGCITYEDTVGCTSCEERFKLIESKCIFQCEGCKQDECSVNYCNVCENWFMESDELGRCIVVNASKIVSLIFIIIIFILFMIIPIVFIIKYQKKKKQERQELEQQLLQKGEQQHLHENVTNQDEEQLQ